MKRNNAVKVRQVLNNCSPEAKGSRGALVASAIEKG